MAAVVRDTFSHGRFIGFVSVEFLLNELGDFGVSLVLPKWNSRLC